MITIQWFLRMIRDVVWFGIANRAPFLSIGILLLIFAGVLIVAAKISAPYIYTLF